MDSPAASPSVLAALCKLDPPAPGDEQSYAEPLRLTERDVPTLVELAKLWTDLEYWEQHADTPQGWAPIHACRALADLGSTAAITTVLDMLDTLDDQLDNWYLELFPDMCARVGSPALDHLRRYVLDRSHREYARVAAAHGLQRIAQEDPTHRDEVVAVLAEGLGRLDTEYGSLNAFFISYLTDLRAVEHAELIEKAFDRGVVSEFVCGGWASIAYELGLTSVPPRPRPTWQASGPPHPGRPKTDKSARKRQKKARKKNRRK